MALSASQGETPPAGLAAAAPDAMTPVAFDGQAGWWHAAAGDVAVVLCPPIGRDARCAYLPLRLLAERLAAAGYGVLRFDYPGEGESLDVDPDGDALAQWRAGVRQAVRFVRRMGVQRVVLAGLRIGATLAAEAAADLGAEALMLLAPVTSGRGWLRELKLRASMASSAFREPDPDAFVSDDLRFSAATVSALQALDLKTLASAPPRVLLRAHAPAAAAALTDPLRAAGAAVSVGGFDGYDMLFEEPHSNLAPQAVYAEAVDWLKAEVPVRARRALAPSPRRLSGDGWTEEGVAFGEGLRGVLCLPTATPAAPEAVVFVSTGGDPRSGLGRFPVTAGRALAREGVASLRFDFAGVGDSRAADGERSHVFETPRAGDVRACADLLESRGFPALALVGVCAGAYHAVRAAASEPRVRGLLAISTLKFVWRPGSGFSLGAGLQEAGATRAYVEGLTDPKVWLRLARGDIQVRRILKALATRAWARLVPNDDAREAAAVRAGLQAFARRGGRMRFLLGVHDSALDEMERWFGREGRGLAAMSASVRIAPGLDHGLSYAASRVIGLEELRRLTGLEAG